MGKVRLTTRLMVQLTTTATAEAAELWHIFGSK
jgi:hypothetical protein